MNDSSRYKHIDSLRGLAVLLVVWLHVSEVYINLSSSVKNNGTLLYDFAWYINFGRIGVVIFFAISGFVLLKSIRGNRINGIKEFLIKRFFRLYPAFWLSVFMGAYVMQLFGHNMSFEKIIANMTMLPQMFNQEMVLGLYWTLEVELIFYFVGLILFLLKSSQKPINLFLISIFFLFVFVISKIMFVINTEHIGLAIIPLNLSIMFWGALGRSYYDNSNLNINLFNKNISIKLLFITLSIIILIIPLLHFFKGIISDDFKNIQIGISYIIGILVFLLLSTKFKIYNKFLVWIGTISYSIYLFHPIVFYSLFWWLKNYAPLSFTEMHLVVYLIINFMLSIVFGSIIYYLIEKPSIRYSHYLISKRNRNI